jgi:lysozyme
MKKLILFLLLGGSLNAAPTFNEYRSHFVKYEGLKTSVYKCSKGFNTVGIGHKFEKGELIKSSYSKEEINTLFAKDLQEAKLISKRVFPSFNSQPDSIQILLCSLSFNLGEGGIRKFVKFKAAIEGKNYRLAAKELENSLWAKQVGNRGRDYIKLLSDLK